MKLSTLIIAICAYILAVEAAVKNSSIEYYLQTKVKPGQSGKSRFDGLWVESYHTGAGLNDAVAVKVHSRSLLYLGLFNLISINRTITTASKAF